MCRFLRLLLITGPQNRCFPLDMVAKSMFMAVISPPLDGAKKYFSALTEEEYDSTLVDWAIDYDQCADGIFVSVRREIAADQIISITSSDLVGQPETSASEISVDATVRMLIFVPILPKLIPM